MLQIAHRLRIVGIMVVVLVLAAAGVGYGQWDQETKLTASDGAANEYFGGSVSLSGDWLVISKPSRYDASAYVFAWDGSAWVDETKLVGSQVSYFANSVSVSGDRLVVGAAGDSEFGYWSGAAYVFAWNGTSWVQQAKLGASDAIGSEQLGHSVSISGDRLIAGAYADGDNGSQSGSAYVFAWNGTSWVEEAKLTASDAIFNEMFGHSVSISEDELIVGAWADDDNGTQSGSAYVFSWDGSGWMEEAKLLPVDGAAMDRFGYSVSVSGNRFLVGANGDDDNGSQSGSAYVFGTPVPDDPPPVSELVAHWAGDVAGTTVPDASGNGHDGTPVGDVASVPGKVGQAFSLDGDGDYILIDQPLGFAKYDYTIEGWFKTNPGEVEGDIFAATEVGAYKHGILIEINSDIGSRLRFLHRPIAGSSGGTNIHSISPVNDGRWHYFVATREEGTNALYVDGVLQGTADEPGDIGFDVEVAMGRLAYLDKGVYS